MELSELRKYAALVGTTIDCRHHLLSPDGAAELVADIDAERTARFNEGWEAAKEESRLLAQRPEQGWGAPATEERQALTARLRALEESAKWMDAFRQSHSKRLQTLENSLGTLAARVMPAGSSSSNTSFPDLLKRVQALEAGKRGETAGYQEQNARIGALETQSDLHQQAHNALIHTCEQELARLGQLANDNIAMRLELGNELKQRIENIERGVTSPAQLVPDMLKRVQRIEMSMETCVRIGDLQFRKATEI
jgi:hypothetical protein